MRISTRFFNYLSAGRSYLGYLLLIMLTILGLMSVVYRVTYAKPTDGGTWEMRGGQLTAVETDLDPDTPFQAGDVLIQIDDLDIRGILEYQDFLYGAIIGSKHLYVIERDGLQDTFEPIVTIRGLDEPLPRAYYLAVICGFFYLSFGFFILGQKVEVPQRVHLIILCLCVYLGFVFLYTETFSLFDWLNVHMGFLGTAFLPSALAALALAQAFREKAYLPALQAIQWTVSGLLLLLKIYWVPNWLDQGGDLDTGMQLFHLVEDVQAYWGGTLILVSAAALTLTSGDRPVLRYNAIFWAVAWLPYGLHLVEIQYPFSDMFSSIAPVLLPIGLLSDWTRQNLLYLGDLGKRTVVNLGVLFLLFLAYLFFLKAFQSLLPSSSNLNSVGHSLISGLFILFAAMFFTPLKDYGTEIVDYLIYGERLSALKGLMDFSGINRADTNLDNFLLIILDRCKNAFGFESGSTYKADLIKRNFRTTEGHEPYHEVGLSELPTELFEGEIAEGGHMGTMGGRKSMSFQPSDLLCPFRVSNRLIAFMVLSSGGRNVKLSPEEMRILQNLLNQCEVLMENMELYQDLKRKALDITQLKEFNENIIESSRIGILATDELGKSVSCNRSLAELAGIRKGQILGKPFDELFRVKELQSSHRAKAGYSMEGIFENAKNDELNLDIQKNALKTKDNEVYGTLYLVEDIREKRELSEKMMQQEKLASIGLLAAGVAHEVNTPLTGITSYSQMLVQDAGLTEDQKELLVLIQDQSSRATNIVKTLLNFSRQGNKSKQPVSVSRVLSETVEFLGHQIQKHGVEVILPQAPPATQIEANANELQQVFMNLTVNALDAMPDGGRLIIDLFENRRKLFLTFEDTGIGMDDQTKSRIFDPFFTTKEVGKGTGLGLSIVYSIIQEHKGTLRVDSQPGRGTKFTIAFPTPAQS